MAGETADIRVQHPVHPPAGQPDEQRIQRIMLGVPRPEPVGEPLEVRLVHGVQHFRDGALDDLVLQRRDAERPQPPVRLRDVHPPRRTCPVAPRLHPGMEIPQAVKEVFPVLRPGHPVHSRGRVLLQALIRLQQPPLRDMMQQRGEPRILIPSRDLAHTAQIT